MSKRLSAVDHVLSEQLWCGGELKTRQQIYDELVAEGFEPYYVGFYLLCLANHQPGECVEEEKEKAP